MLKNDLMAYFLTLTLAIASFTPLNFAGSAEGEFSNYPVYAGCCTIDTESFVEFNVLDTIGNDWVEDAKTNHALVTIEEIARMIPYLELESGRFMVESTMIITPSYIPSIAVNAGIQLQEQQIGETIQFELIVEPLVSASDIVWLEVGDRAEGNITPFSWCGGSYEYGELSYCNKFIIQTVCTFTGRIVHSVTICQGRSIQIIRNCSVCGWTVTFSHSAPGC